MVQEKSFEPFRTKETLPPHNAPPSRTISAIAAPDAEKNNAHPSDNKGQAPETSPLSPAGSNNATAADQKNYKLLHLFIQKIQKIQEVVSKVI